MPPNNSRESDVKLILGVDVGVSTENIRKDIEKILSDINQDKHAIKIEIDEDSLKNMESQVDGTIKRINSLSKGALKAIQMPEVEKSSGGSKSVANAYGELIRQTTEYKKNTQDVSRVISTYKDTLTGLVTTITEVANKKGQLVVSGKKVVDSLKTEKEMSELASRAQKEYVASLVSIASLREKVARSGGAESAEYKNVISLLDIFKSKIKEIYASSHVDNDPLAFLAGKEGLAAQFNLISGAVDAYSNSQRESARAQSESADAAQRYVNMLLEVERAISQANTQKASLEGLRDSVKTADQEAEYNRLTDAINKYINELKKLRGEYDSSNPEKHRLAMTSLRTEYEKNRDSINKFARSVGDEEKRLLKLANASNQVTNLRKQASNALSNYTKAENSGNESSRIAYQRLKELDGELSQLYAKFERGEISTSEFNTGLTKMREQFTQSVQTIKANGDATKTWGERLSGLATKFSYWLSASQLIMQTIRAVRQLITTSIELEDSMTQLRIVTDETDEKYTEFGNNIAHTAQEIGASVTDLINATTTYARLGYSLDESSVLSKLTGQLQMVGNVEAQDAQNAVTAIIKAYGKGVDEMELVMDRMVDVGNNFPISVSEISEGMNNASSALAAAGNSFEESIALLTAANTTIQNASRSSTGLRTIVARIRNVKTELEDLGEEVLTTAKYEDLVKALTDKGVELTDKAGQFRSTYAIISDIAKAWKEMSANEQAALAQTLAGTRQQAVFYSLVEQFQEASGAMDRMTNSAGTLSEAYEEFMQSTTAHINAFKSAFAGLSSDVMQGDFLKFFIDLGTRIINIIDKVAKLVNVVGGLRPVLVSVAGIVGAIKIQALYNIITKLFSPLTSLITVLGTLMTPLREMSPAMQSAAVFSSKLSVALSEAGISASAAQIAFAGVVMAISAVIAIYSAWKRKHDEMIQAAKEASSELTKQAESTHASAQRIKELKDALDSGNLSEEQSLQAKEELKSIQEELISTYGKQAEAIDLVNGKYDEEIEKIRELSAEEAKRFINEKKPQIDNAVEAIEGNVGYTLAFLGSKARRESRDGIDEIRNLLEKYKGIIEIVERPDGTSLLQLLPNVGPEEADKYMNDLASDIRALEKEFGEKPLFTDIFEGTRWQISENKKILDEHLDIYKGYRKSLLEEDTELRNNKTASEWLYSLSDAVKTYNEAVAIGEPEKIYLAGGALRNIQTAISNTSGMEQYSREINEILRGVSQIPQTVEDTKVELKTKKIHFSDLFSGSDKESEQTAFEQYINDYREKMGKLDEALESIRKKTFGTKSFNELVAIFPQLQGHFSDIEPAIEAVRNELMGANGAAGYFEETLSTLASDTDKQRFMEYTNAVQSEVSGVADSFQRLLIGEDGKATTFKTGVDDYVEKMGMLNDALDSLAQNVDPDEVMLGLVETFPELMSDAGDLESAIRSLMDALTGSNGPGGATGLFKLFEGALSEVATEEDRVRLEEYLRLVLRTTGALGGFDYTSGRVSNFTSTVGTMRNVLNSQGTGKVITPEDYRTLHDYTSALEFYNGELRYNEEKVHEITKAKAEEQKAIIRSNKAQDQSQYLKNAAEIEKLRRSLSMKAKLTTEDQNAIKKNIASLLSQNATLLKNSRQYDLLADSIDQATSAYQRWLDSKNEEKPGTMFSEAAEAMQKIDNVLNYHVPDDKKDKQYLDYGNIGDPEYLAALNFVIPESISRNDEEGIRNYIESIAKYFSYDENGDYLGMNIIQFLDDAVSAGLMEFDGKYYNIIGERAMSEFVDGMNLSLPLIQAMFDYMELKGSEFKFAREGSESLDELHIRANEAAEALYKLDRGKDIKIALDVSDFDSAEKAERTLNYDIAEMNRLKAKPGVDASEIEYANTIIEYCVRQKQYLSRPEIMKVDASQVTGELGEAVTLLQRFWETKNEIEVNKELGLDTSEAAAELETIIGEIQTLNESNPEVFASINVDPSSANTIQTSINNLSAEMLITAGIDESIIEDYEAPEKESEVVYKVDDELVRKYEAAKKYSWVVFNVDDTHVKEYIENNKEQHMDLIIHEKKVSTPAGMDTQLNGTAHAGGYWGTKKKEHALVGELGTEIIVDGKTGRWYTVGDHGAEFAEIPEGAIVFNHKQTKALLSNGHIFGRGKALASGSAHVNNTDTVKGRFSAEKASRSTYGNEVNTYEEVYDAVYDATTDANNDSGGSNDNAEKGPSALEKFQEWFQTLFDWIEVKLQRTTDRIEQYVQKAERASESGSYRSAAGNYYSAIKESTKLSDYNSRGALRYEAEANRVLGKAVTMGVISQKTAESIAQKVAKGTIDIREYSDKVREVISSYQQWYDKSEECKQSIQDLHDNIREYIGDLKDLRDAQRDARIERIENRLDIGNGGITTLARGNRLANQQLRYSNAQIANENKAYSTAVSGANLDVNNLRKSARSIVRKENRGTSNEAYKKALKSASNAMKNKKPVSSSDMKVIRDNSRIAYERVYAYNLSLENLETARMEKALEYAANSAEIYQNIADIYNNKDEVTGNNLSLFQQKSSNAKTAKAQNKYLKQAAKTYDTVLKNDNAEISKYSAELKKSRKQLKKNATSLTGQSEAIKKSVKAVVDKARQSAKSGKNITPAVLAKLAEYYEKGYVTATFYQACINYNNALASRDQAKAQRVIDKETAKAEKASIGAQMVSNVENEYNNRLRELGYTTTEINSKQKLKTTRGLSLTQRDYKQLIAQSQQEAKLYDSLSKSMRATILKNLSSGYWTRKSQEYKDAMEAYKGYRDSIRQCKIAQEEWNNAIVQIPFDKINAQLQYLDSQSAYLEAQRKLREARGEDLSEKDYQDRINELEKQQIQLQREADEALENYNNAKANKDDVYGGQTAREWRTQYYEALTNLINIDSEIEEIKDDLRDDVFWRTFERAHGQVDRIKKVLQEVDELLDNSMFFDSAGSMTEYGVAHVANLVKQFELARDEVQNYSNDIANLLELEDTYYTKSEYREKLADLQESLLGAASEVKSVTDSIVDMYKTMAQSELDALFELIDARQEALNKKKE